MVDCARPSKRLSLCRGFIEAMAGRQVTFCLPSAQEPAKGIVWNDVVRRNRQVLL